MTQLGDVHVKPPMRGPTGDSPIRTAALAIVALLVIGIGLYWFFGRGTEQVEPPTVVATDTPLIAPPPEPVTPPAAPVELPELDASDTFVRGLVAALSAHPDLARWLVTGGLVRRFVVAVDNIAEGTNPAQHVMFMTPDSPFSVMSGESGTTIATESYRRYDVHAQIVDSLDTQGTAELYRTLEPLMDEAYVELGYPDARFRPTLERAVARLLETPLLDEAPTVSQRVAFYEYADATLEALAPAQKQFLGIGPTNMRIVQAKLFEISRVIGISTNR